MKLKNLAYLVLALSLLLGVGGPATADDRPHEGKVISVDKEAMVLVVQGDKDDQHTLYWTKTTKLKGDVTVEELKVGDKIHFEFVDKDEKMWLTEIRRTDKAKG
jgi:Cu/Ag efflux protein CusF